MKAKSARWVKIAERIGKIKKDTRQWTSANAGVHFHFVAALTSFRRGAAQRLYK